MQAHEGEDARLVLLRQLANPVRLGVLDLLAERGPSPASELASHLGVSASRLSNHLQRLRNDGLVEVGRSGRQIVYSLSSEQAAELLAALARLVGHEPDEPPRPSRFALARTCFDHLAGTLGVSLFDRLVELDALRPMERTEVVLGPPADEVFTGLGVDLRAVRSGRRRFACSCSDATERRSHLGGALGAALTTTFADKGWITVRQEHREVDVTAAGRRGLRTVLQLNGADLGAG